MIYRCKFRSGVGRGGVDDENRDGDDDGGSGYPENVQVTKMLIMMMTRAIEMMMTITVRIVLITAMVMTKTAMKLIMMATVVIMLMKLEC